MTWKIVETAKDETASLGPLYAHHSSANTAAVMTSGMSAEMIAGMNVGTTASTAVVTIAATFAAGTAGLPSGPVAEAARC